MVAVAVIPARGGSKRIPHKNIKLFCGKPIIAHPIEVALSSKLFDQVIVSTDDAEIADTAESYGATVPFIRPNHLSNDYVGTNEVVKHAIQYLLDSGHEVEYVCCIYATAALLQPDFLRQGFAKLREHNYDFVFSATSFPFPIQRGLYENEDGSVVPCFPNQIRNRSQDLPPAIHDAGQFYWGRASSYLEEKKIFSRHSSVIRLPRHLAQDIDTLEDWEYAELMYQLMHKNTRSELSRV